MSSVYKVQALWCGHSQCFLWPGSPPLSTAYQYPGFNHSCRFWKDHAPSTRNALTSLQPHFRYLISKLPRILQCPAQAPSTLTFPRWTGGSVSLTRSTSSMAPRQPLLTLHRSIFVSLFLCCPLDCEAHKSKESVCLIVISPRAFLSSQFPGDLQMGHDTHRGHF